MNKKLLIFLMMFLVFLVSIKAQWYYDDINRTGTEHQTQGSWTGNLIQIREINFTRMNIFKYSLDTATICSVFGNNESPSIQLSNNFTFVNDNCSITFDFQVNTSYIIATFDTDYSYEQYYDLTGSPKDSENLGSWIYATWNNPTTWHTIKGYSGSFFNTEEYHDLGRLDENLTQNITENTTASNKTCDYCHYYRNAGDFYELLPILILYIFLIITGYSLIKTGSYLSGLLVLVFSFMVDAILIWLYYDKYVNGLIIDSSIGSIANYVFGFGLLVWVIIKFIVIFNMKVIKRERRF